MGRWFFFPKGTAVRIGRCEEGTAAFANPTGVGMRGLRRSRQRLGAAAPVKAALTPSALRRGSQTARRSEHRFSFGNRALTSAGLTPADANGLRTGTPYAGWVSSCRKARQAGAPARARIRVLAMPDRRPWRGLSVA